MRSYPILGILVIAGGCAAAPDAARDPISVVLAEQAPPVPERPALDRKWSSNAEGYTFSVGYFTPEQEASPEWETARLASRNMASVCHEKRLVRREVRWFDPAVVGGPRCARVVYSFTCEPNKGAVQESLDYASTQALLDEPNEPIPPGCGEKDWFKLPPSDTFRYALKGQLTRGIRCSEQLPDETKGALRLGEVTYIKTRTLFSTQFVSKHQHEIFERSSAFLGTFARAEGKRHIVAVDGDLVPDDKNIFLDFVTTDWGDDGYCLSLIARQGQNLWKRTIQRNTVPLSNRALEDGYGHSKDPGEYWTPDIDAHTLVHQLAGALGLPLPPEHAQK